MTGRFLFSLLLLSCACLQWNDQFAEAFRRQDVPARTLKLKETSRQPGEREVPVVDGKPSDHQYILPVGSPAACTKLESQLTYSAGPIEIRKLSQSYLLHRKRFQNQFYFDGLTAEWISKDGRKVKFADQTIYMGQALLVFATEAKIRTLTNDEPSDCFKVIAEILDAFDELDLAANRRYDEEPASNLNGLFVRDNVTGINDPRLNVRFSKVESDWQSAAKENASPSGDQIFSLMTGLLAVHEFVDDEAFQKRARDTAERLFDYARSSNFVLKLPNGKPTRRGSKVWWTSSLLHGANKRITGRDRFNKCNIEPVPGLKLSLNPVAALWENAGIARVVRSCIGRSMTIPIIDEKLSVNSFALHLFLMSLAPQDVWSQRDVELTCLKANHHLAILLYCVLHSVRPQQFTRSEIDQILNLCPATGPAADLDRTSRWQQDNRWVRCTRIHEPKDGTHRYNGLDWMALHNLSELAFGRYAVCR